jgi:hypothetical protein
MWWIIRFKDGEYMIRFDLENDAEFYLHKHYNEDEYGLIYEIA